MINILFSGNEKVFDAILSCMLSIFRRTRTKEPFRIFIYTMDMIRVKPEYTAISEEMADFLDTVAKSFNKENEVIRIDVTKDYERDLLFNRDICLLYDTDVTGYEYAAARDHYGKYLVSPNYVNAGVLLFNMREIRKTGLLEKSRRLIKTKKLVFADQSAIIRSTTRKKMLPQKYNDQKFLHKSTVVRHFSKRLFYLPYPHTDNIKQWDVGKVHRVFHYYDFDDILSEYMELKKKYVEEKR